MLEEGEEGEKSEEEELARLRLKIANLERENAGLQLESASFEAQHDAAQAHAVFASQQFTLKKKELLKRVLTSAQVLTLREVRKEIEQDAAKKVQKQKVEAEREMQKAEAEISFNVLSKKGWAQSFPGA
ncbi:hypothetical protein EV359DRAFT_67774 [Lentinula novae-zelandiae]|nr:hypothetical protein EV359DRAFT_67774 [Lentinula novae-zelandiae]